VIEGELTSWNLWFYGFGLSFSTVIDWFYPPPFSLRIVLCSVPADKSFISAQIPDNEWKITQIPGFCINPLKIRCISTIFRRLKGALIFKKCKMKTSKNVKWIDWNL
jgi:hypothetical protein